MRARRLRTSFAAPPTRALSSRSSVCSACSTSAGRRAAADASAGSGFACGASSRCSATRISSSTRSARSCGSEEMPKRGTILTALPPKVSFACSSCARRRSASFCICPAEVPGATSRKVASAARAMESSARICFMTSLAMRASNWSAASCPAVRASSPWLSMRSAITDSSPPWRRAKEKRLRVSVSRYSPVSVPVSASREGSLACRAACSSFLLASGRSTLSRRARTSPASADLLMKSFAPDARARSFEPGSSTPEITTTGSSRMRSSLASRMRESRPKPFNFGMSRSVNTMMIDGSLWMADHAASPSAASRTSNAPRRMVAKVVRTNFESSTTSTRFFACSAVGARALLRKVHHDPAIDLGVDEVVEHARQLAERDRAAHLFQERRLQVAREALPDLLADVARALARVDAEQAHAAQDEGHHRRMEIEARRETDGGDDAVLLHRARDPGKHLAAEIVDRARPAGFVEGPDLLQVDALAQHHFGCADLLQPLALARFARQRHHLIAALGQHGNRHGADAAGRAVDQHRPALGCEAVVLHAMQRDAGGVAGGAEGHRFPERQPLRYAADPVALHARVRRVAAIVRHADVFAACGEHGVALLPAGIRRFHHRAGEIDAADGRGPAQDFALAGDGERVLVVHVRIRHAYDDVTGIEFVERVIDELGADLLVRRLGELVGLEAFHGLLAIPP